MRKHWFLPAMLILAALTLATLASKASAGLAPATDRFATVSTSVSSLTGVTLVTPSSGKRLTLKAGTLSANAAGTITFYDGATAIYTVYCAQYTEYKLDPTILGELGLRSAAADTSLKAIGVSGQSLILNVRYSED